MHNKKYTSMSSQQKLDLETQKLYQSQINDAINEENIDSLKELLETGVALSDMKNCTRSRMLTPLEPVDENNAIITAIKKGNVNILKMVLCQHDRNMKKQGVLWNGRGRNRFLTYYQSFVSRMYLTNNPNNPNNQVSVAIVDVFTALNNNPDTNFDNILKRWDDELKQQNVDQKKQGIITQKNSANENIDEISKQWKDRLKQQNLDQKKQGIIKPIITIIAVIVITAIIAPQIITLIAVLAGVISSALVYNAYKINKEMKNTSLKVSWLDNFFKNGGLDENKTREAHIKERGAELNEDRENNNYKP